jgi:hypothetical protein
MRENSENSPHLQKDWLSWGREYLATRARSYMERWVLSMLPAIFCCDRFVSRSWIVAWTTQQLLPRPPEGMSIGND